MKALLLLFLTIFISRNVTSQTFIVSGQVSDSTSGEYLPGATAYCYQTKGGVACNDWGFFSIKVIPGINTLEFSYVGYKKQLVQLFVANDTLITINLLPDTELSEVTVTAEGNLQRLQSTTVSTHTITAKSIEGLPALMGETDIIKQVRTLPGVSAAAEGASGLIVRGSGPDGTLVLYDGVPLYNINHMYGFFSVFNTDALSSAQMYKGAYPARFGGRVSSVLDVRMREGNLNKLQGSISIGSLVSKLTIEGPLIKDKASFVISARRSYIDLFTNYLFNLIEPGEGLGYFFEDYNLKLNYKINSKNRLFASAYTGKDKYEDKQEDDWGTYKSNKYMDWGNSLVSVRLNSLISPKLFLNTTAYISRYRYKAGEDRTVQRDSNYLGTIYIDAYNKTQFTDYALKNEIDYKLSARHSVKTGIHFIYHDFLPNSYNVYALSNKNISTFYEPEPVYKVDTTIIVKELEKIESFEWHLFAEDEFQLSDKIKINGGLHYSGFWHKTAAYNYLLPRFSLVYLPQKNLSIKVASGLYSQYSILVSDPTVGLPTDVWLQSTHGLKPLLGWQSVIGAMYNTNTDWLFSIETYYKLTKNVADFKEMVSMNDFTSWNDVFEQGQARGYGFEFMVEKHNEKYNFKASYAHNRSIQEFDNLNRGRPYYYTYDSPHNINFECLYKFNKHIDMGISWVFSSGKLMTLVENEFPNFNYYEYEYINKVSQNYSPGAGSFFTNRYLATVTERNNHRTEPYHRLDVGVNFKKEKKRGLRTWSFGIYNVYNRKNVFFVTNVNYKGYVKQSMPSILPYFAYSFKF